MIAAEQLAYHVLDGGLGLDVVVLGRTLAVAADLPEKTYMFLTDLEAGLNIKARSKLLKLLLISRKEFNWDSFCSTLIETQARPGPVPTLDIHHIHHLLQQVIELLRTKLQQILIIES